MFTVVKCGTLAKGITGHLVVSSTKVLFSYGELEYILTKHLALNIFTSVLIPVIIMRVLWFGKSSYVALIFYCHKHCHGFVKTYKLGKINAYMSIMFSFHACLGGSQTQLSTTIINNCKQLIWIQWIRVITVKWQSE